MPQENLAQVNNSAAACGTCSTDLRMLQSQLRVAKSEITQLNTMLVDKNNKLEQIESKSRSEKAALRHVIAQLKKKLEAEGIKYDDIVEDDFELLDCGTEESESGHQYYDCQDHEIFGGESGGQQSSTTDE